MLRRWAPPALLLTLGAGAWAVGRPVWYFVVLTLLALLVSPLVFPQPLTAAEARRRSAADGRAIIYWRPGCPYCLRLRATLAGEARKVYWVDIWKDPEAAAAVRAVADGNETVPTVILAGVPHVNPNPRWLLDQLRAG